MKLISQRCPVVIRNDHNYCFLLFQLLPASNISRNKETATEVAKLKQEEMVFKYEAKKHRSGLKKGEEELEQMKLSLKELEVDGFLNNDMVGRNMKENKHATEASTSQEPTAHLP